MTSVLILHGYSAHNKGDGLLVEETLRLVHDAWPDAEVTLVASDPDSFADLVETRVRSKPKASRDFLAYLGTLWRVRRFDAVVAVGGGYLRFGRPAEALKAGIVHLPQLIAAGTVGERAVYLPQSIGPVRFGLRPLIRSLVGRVGAVALRDDRSVAEVGGLSTFRRPDLALLRSDPVVSVPAAEPADAPVLSVRQIRGALPAGVVSLAERLRPFDGYVQSETPGNDDRPAVRETSPTRVLSRQEFLGAEGPRRVVVAVRLHAALMAIDAGHYVVHLAYERKGFGAFRDLGLEGYVHNVNSFDVDLVEAQLRELLSRAEARADYAALVARQRAGAAEIRRDLVSLLASRARGLASGSDSVPV